MQLGIFAKTFVRPTVEDVFDAVRAHGLRCVQFNLSCAGVPTLPDEIAPSLITRIREASHQRDIEIAAVSGTYNMIHPDQVVQQRGLRRLRTLAAACQGLGTAFIKVVIDPANLIVPGDERPMSQVMDETFDLLGEHIVIAHAKDRGADGSFRAAGEGILDYDYYLRLLQASTFPGPLIIHGLAEAQVDAALQFIHGKLQRR